MKKTLPILKKHKDFVNISKNGQYFVTIGLILQKLKRLDNEILGDVIRVGFTTSKKVGNAVKRNRIRRRLRVLARDILPLLGEKQTDYVLIGRSATFNRAFEDLEKDLKFALKHIK